MSRLTDKYKQVQVLMKIMIVTVIVECTKRLSITEYWFLKKVIYNSCEGDSPIIHSDRGAHYY